MSAAYAYVSAAKEPTEIEIIKVRTADKSFFNDHCQLFLYPIESLSSYLYCIFKTCPTRDSNHS